MEELRIMVQDLREIKGLNRKDIQDLIARLDDSHLYDLLLHQIYKF